MYEHLSHTLTYTLDSLPPVLLKDSWSDNFIINFLLYTWIIPISTKYITISPLIFVFFKVFIHLAMQGLSYSRQTLSCSMWDLTVP